MLKKINVADVRLGMYLHELCGSWMDHPFWRSAFKLADPKDLQTLQQSGIREVWIDTSKGLDVEVHVVADTAEKQALKTKETLEQASASAPTTEKQVSLQDELDRARRIHARAKQAVVSMFQEARMGKALDVAEAATLVEEINQSVARNPGAMLSLARLKNKDDYTYLHSVAVCALMIALGRQMGQEGEVLRELGLAGLLHDVGKMAIPDQVLNKPGRLTDQEFDIVKAHPTRGWEMLKASYGANELALDVCLHHHERVDGAGYPERLSGEALSLFARMGAVCDVYDAITSDRCYKAGWAPGEAIRKMAEWKDGHFDDAVFKAFVKTVGIFPTGSLVKLKSGRLAVVTDQSSKSLLTPIVRVFFSTKSMAPIVMEYVDLSRSQDAIENVEDPGKWGFDLSKVSGI